MVLLIDDDPTTNYLHRRAIRKVLNEVKVDEVLNGEDALDLLEANFKAGAMPPEFIFLDLNMPHLDGWGFLERFRKLPQSWRSKTHLYVLTTSLNPDDHSRAKEFSDVKGVIDKLLTHDKFAHLLAKQTDCEA